MRRTNLSPGSNQAPAVSRGVDESTHPYPAHNQRRRPLWLRRGVCRPCSSCAAGPPRWPGGPPAVICMGAPVLVGWLAGGLTAGLTATSGGFTAPLWRRSPVQESREAGMGQQGRRIASDRGDAGDLLEDGRRPRRSLPLAGAGSGPGGQLGLPWPMRTGSGMMMIRTVPADGAGWPGFFRCAGQVALARRPLPLGDARHRRRVCVASAAPADSPGTGQARGMDEGCCVQGDARCRCRGCRRCPDRAG